MAGIGRLDSGNALILLSKGFEIMGGKAYDNVAVIEALRRSPKQSRPDSGFFGITVIKK